MWWKWDYGKRCCPLFAEGLESQGQAGLSFVPVIDRGSKRRYFRMEFWSLSRGEIEAGCHIVTVPARRIILNTRQNVRFCPFCGRNLVWFYRLTFDSLPGVTDADQFPGD
jgi:hypothetical protein